MRKLFLLIPALLIAMMTNAEVKTIGSTDPTAVNSDVLIAALQSANDGDVIILRDGIYNEHSNYIVFNKNVEVKAADGAKPVVEVECYIKVQGNKNIKIKGIKFDADLQGPTGNNSTNYSYFMRVYGAGTLELDGCEFCNTRANRVIQAVEDTTHIDFLKINDCYFHDGNNSAIYIAAGSTAHVCDRLDITNSTFANYTGVADALIRVNTKNGVLSEVPEDDAVLNVDHCTFYNFIKTNNDTYGFIDSRKSTKVAISNCIIVNPDVEGGNYAMATQTYGGTVSYCLDYGTKGHRLTCSNRVNKDPLFVDAANADYTLHGASPARTADENGAALGDPRWAKEIRPATDFSTPLVLAGIDATLENRIELDANYYLHQKNNEDATLNGTATWLFRAEEACNIKVTLNMSDATTSGHIYQVAIFDADDHAVGSPLSESWDNNTDDKTLSGFVTIPTAGNYKAILSNSADWSSATIKGITLSYSGGKVVNIPDTLKPVDALLSATAWVDKSGEVDSLKFATGNSNVPAQWAKWKVSVAQEGKYQFVASVKSNNGQNYAISVLSEDETSTLSTSYGTGTSSGARLITSENIDLTPGNYVVMIQDTVNWSYGRVLYIAAKYNGGKMINVPDTLKPVDAIKSARAYVDEEGYLRFTNDSESGHILEESAKWNMHVSKAGNYKFTVEAISSNSQAYELILSNSDESVIVESMIKKGEYNHPLSFAMEVANLAVGDYVMTIKDTTLYSRGRVQYIAPEYIGGAVNALPGQIVGDDALLTGNIIRLENRDLKSSNTSSPTAEYAEWNVSFAAAGTMTVQLNLDPVTSSGHNYRVELYNGNDLIGYAEELASTDPDEAKYTKGDIDLEQMIAVPDAGNYTVKLVNRTQWSSMILQGITFAEYIAPAAITMTDTDTDNTAWVANVGGAACNVQLERTILGGMYNAICLPFALTGSQVKAAFGNDVELYYLNNASLDGEVLNLQFAVANDIYQGTPYLIKTSSNVVNPTFNGVSIVLAEASSTYHSEWPVAFKGSFVAQNISGSDNLLLYANDRVGFSTSDATLKGFRAYFHLMSSSLAPAIKHARIVTPHGSTTAFELVETQSNGTIKTIENGQIIIIRDGVHYNVMGARVK